MPVFLDPNAQELNDLRSVKIGVSKALKRQYKGTETTSGLEGDIQDKFNYMYEKMVSIIASLGEISNQLTLGHTSVSQFGSKAIDRFISGTSAVEKDARALLNYMYQQVPSINIFSTDQQQTISGLNDQMVAAVKGIDDLSATYLEPSSLARFRSVINGIKEDLVRIQQRLEGQGTGDLGSAFTQEGRRRRGRARPSDPFGVDSGEGGDDEDGGDGGKKIGKRKSPRKESKKVSEAVAAIEGKGYRMPNMYGDGYRTAITAGMMPSRFL
jgi:hypothetical protein